MTPSAPLSAGSPGDLRQGALRVLLLEDDPSDAELIVRELERDGRAVTWSRVEDEDAFRMALAEGPDAIISDYSLSGYDGIRALELTQELDMEVPFLLVSGKIGEVRAAEAIRIGASDYVLKDHLERLGPALDRALQQRRLVVENNRQEAALRESEERFRQLAENVHHVFWIAEFEEGDGRRMLYVNPAYEAIFGLPRDELLRDPASWERIVHPEDHDRVVASRRRIGEVPTEQELRIVRPDGETRWIRDRTFPILDPAGRIYRVAGVAEDVTEQMAADRQIREMEERLRFLVSMTPGTIYSLGVEEPHAPTFVSDNALAHYGYPTESLMDARFWIECVHPDDRAGIPQALQRLFAAGVTSQSFRFRRPDGAYRWMRDELRLVRSDDGRPVEIIGHSLDITDLMEAEQELQEGLQRLRRSDAERRWLLARLIHAQEEERQSIAADIHDDSVQVMTAVGLRLETLKRRVDGAEGLGLLTSLQETVELATARLRHLLFELRPRVLDTDGIDAALRFHLEQMCPGAGLEHELVSDLVSEPPTDTRIVLYRMAQEALTNVRKHARATKVSVAIRSDEGGYRVAVTDDGVGFDPESRRAGSEADAQARVGLASMRDRAESAGGWWRATSAPGAGTTIEFWLPPIDAPTTEPRRTAP